MNIIQAVILGIVEGVTEFLPVSSTGHLIIASKLLDMAQTEALKSFEIAIQLGAIAAVVALYWRKLLMDAETMKRVAVAFVPTGILGLILYKLVKSYLLSNETVVIWALLIGGIALVVFEGLHKAPTEAATDVRMITYRQAAIIGSAQALAMVPGVSRSAATIVGGLALGVSRPAIVEFSFLLAVPTMLAATGLDLVKSAGSFSSADVVALAVGSTVSFAVALLSVRWLLKFVRTRSFFVFGAYRIFAALFFWAVLL